MKPCWKSDWELRKVLDASTSALEIAQSQGKKRERKGKEKPGTCLEDLIITFLHFLHANTMKLCTLCLARNERSEHEVTITGPKVQCQSSSCWKGSMLGDLLLGVVVRGVGFG